MTAGRVIRSPAAAFLRGCLPDFVCEAQHHGGIAQDVELRVGRFRADCPHDIREAAAPVSPHPAPVFCLLGASAQRPPGASQEGEVQDDDGVGCPQPDLQRRVIRSEVAVQDPAAALDQLVLAGSPPGRVHRGRAGLPEQRIELDGGNACHVAELPCQGRLARAAPAEDDHSSHAIMMPAAPRPPDMSSETAPAQVIERYPARWSVEVAIEDSKQIFGAGQARNRTARAAERAIPFQLACQAITVTWYATAGHHPADVEDHRARAPWYRAKARPSTADMAAKLRRVLIAARFQASRPDQPTPEEINVIRLAWEDLAA